MECDCKTCACSAHTFARWGGDNLKTQEANLCETHLVELWRRLNLLTRMDKAWLTLKPVETDVGSLHCYSRPLG